VAANDYALIRRHQPIFARAAAKTARYELDDRFLVFWFRCGIERAKTNWTWLPRTS